MKIITTLLFLALSGYLNAQTTIRGSFQEENNNPLEAASISLIKGSDTLAYRSTMSDRNGKFSFSSVPAGSWYVRLTSVGHEAAVGAVFTIAPGSKLIDLPVFSLKKQNNELQSVAVVVKKPFIEQKADRILVNVD